MTDDESTELGKARRAWDAAFPKAPPPDDATLARTGNPHIIAGAKDGQPKSDLKKPGAAVCKAAGLDGLRIHDLRHTFASVGVGASMGLPVIGMDSALQKKSGFKAPGEFTAR